MADLHIGREPLAEVRGESTELVLARHWDEVAFYKDIPLDVDWPFYEAADAEGLLRAYVVREGSRLVGYAVYLFRRPPHYKSSLQAFQDVLYLAPEYRRGTAGIQLVAYGDAMLKAEGAQVVTQHSKIDHSIAPILRRLRYQRVEEIWAKRLDRD